MKISRTLIAAIIPILLTNIVQLWGILFLRWPISNAFFLFWYEFLIISFITILQVMLYFKNHPLPTRLKRNLSFQLVTITAVMFVLLSAFFLVVYKGENGTREGLASYAGALAVPLLIIAANYAYSFWRTYIRDHAYRMNDFNVHTRQLVEKGFMFGIIYFIYIMQYHWSNSRAIVPTREYLVFMVTALIAAKIVVEGALAVRFKRNLPDSK